MKIINNVSLRKIMSFLTVNRENIILLTDDSQVNLQFSNSSVRENYEKTLLSLT